MFGLGKSKDIDAMALDMMEFALKLTKKLQSEDEGNFICFNLFGMDNNNVVSFKRASEIFLKIIYCGNWIVSVWEQDDYKPFLEYRSFFNIFEEKNGDRSFCAKINLHGSDAVALLNKALAKEGFSPKAEKNAKSLYFNLL